MRAIFAFGVACVLSISAAQAAAVAPTTADDAALMLIEASQDYPADDRSADRWQGRQHYLYDNEYQPGSETVGAAAADSRACATRPVRIRNADGTTVVRRVKRCD
jgi:hypothetical protein